MEEMCAELDDLSRRCSGKGEIGLKIDSLVVKFRSWRQSVLREQQRRVDLAPEGETDMPDRKIATLYVPGGDVSLDKDRHLHLALRENARVDQRVRETVDSLNRRLRRTSGLVDSFGRPISLQDPASDEVLDAVAALLCSRTHGGLIMHHVSRELSDDRSHD
jgi:hypothetical protein